MEGTAPREVEMEPTAPESVDEAPASSRGPFLLVALVVALGMIGVIALSGGDPSTDGDAAAAGGEVYAFPFATAEGDSVTLATYEGTPLVVNFFAAWCPPCRAELPDFDTVAAEVDGEVAVIGVSRDSTVGEWQGLITATGISFDTLYEGAEGGLFEYVQGAGLPTTIFVDAEGTVVHQVSGALDADGLRGLIDEHLVEG